MTIPKTPNLVTTGCLGSGGDTPFLEGDFSTSRADGGGQSDDPPSGCLRGTYNKCHTLPRAWFHVILHVCSPMDTWASNCHHLEM